MSPWLRPIERTLPAQRAQTPNIPAEFWDRFAARARADIGVLVDSLAPVYAARFSRTELDRLLAFYESPVGRHLVAEQPAIAQESHELGRRWSTRMGAALAVETRERGQVAEIAGFVKPRGSRYFWDRPQASPPSG